MSEFFFAASRSFTVSQIAEMVGARQISDEFASREISSVAPLSSHQGSALTFVEAPKHKDQLSKLIEGAILCPPDLIPHLGPGVAGLECSAPYAAFVKCASRMYENAVKPSPLLGTSGVSPAAHVHPDAELEDGVIVEPGAVVGAGAKVGAGTILAPGAVIGNRCSVGRNSYIGPHAALLAALVGDNVIIHSGTRIGQDGFGYAPGPEGLQKMPQLGRVIIQNHVEIGANTTIDRGAMSDTVIGEGTKIDNLVQIGHNTKIGRCCAIAGQCGISGSVEIGDFVMMGGGAGIKDHVKIGSMVRIAAASGVGRDLIEPGDYMGAPAKPARDYIRELKAIHTLARSRKSK